MQGKRSTTELLSESYKEVNIVCTRCIHRINAFLSKRQSKQVTQ